MTLSEQQTKLYEAVRNIAQVRGVYYRFGSPSRFIVAVDADADLNAVREAVAGTRMARRVDVEIDGRRRAKLL